MLNFSFNSLGEAWIHNLFLIMNSGNIIYDNGEKLKEVCGLSLTLSDVSMDDIISKFADKERIELMRKKYCTCGLVGDYKVDYGSYLFNNNGINQIEWVVNKLKSKAETKSATVGTHKPGESQLSCLSLLDFKIRQGKLIMGAIYRSQNAYASLPGNILVLRKIQEDIANELKISVGTVELIAFSSHIYHYDFKAVKELLSKASYIC